MKKVIIKEKHVREIIVATDGATMTFTKYGKKDTEYHVRYGYKDDVVPEGKRYCKYCGDFYDEENTRCPECDDTEFTVNYKDIEEEIKACYGDGDGLTITIINWDETRYEFPEEEE